MPKTLVPTTKQTEIRNAPELGVLVIAPAGCGKTEALALRVQGLIDQRRVLSPQHVLVLTFTNRARDNIRERLQNHLSTEHMRAMVTVSNFHGLAARLIRAHGNVIGIAPDVGIPSSDWAKRMCRDDYRLGYDAVDAITTLLRVAKQSPRTDAEVLVHLRASSSAFAVQLEERRQAEGRITYDDMLRLAELILANEQVAELYRNHFAAIVVDEFQDLTPQQLRVVQRIGLGRTTYAGDLAQGIYSFAGAEPEQILAEIRAEVTHEVAFAESHRSSPAVLDLVNAMAPTVKGQALTCADPDAWPRRRVRERQLSRPSGRGGLGAQLRQSGARPQTPSPHCGRHAIPEPSSSARLDVRGRSCCAVISVGSAVRRQGDRGPAA